MAIPTPPIPPSRSDPANFAARGDDTLAYLPAFVTAANALLVDITYKHGQIMALATGVAGSLNGVPVGLEAPAAGAFTTLMATDGISSSNENGTQLIANRGSQNMVIGADHLTPAYVGSTSNHDVTIIRGGVPVAVAHAAGLSVTGALTTSGNGAFGVAPSDWGGYRAVQIGQGASLSSAVSMGAVLSANAYNNNGAGWKYASNGVAMQYEQYGGGHYWSSAPSGTAGQPTTFTQHMTLTQDGSLLLGPQSGAWHVIRKPHGQGAGLLSVGGYPISAHDTLTIFGVSGAAQSSAEAGMQIGQNTVTGRSINAGGTINAGGSDGAEYERNNGLSFFKGDIVGFAADGTLTDRYVDAIRFGIKSTNPSWVGGDTWGGEDKVGKRPEHPVYVAPVYDGSPKPEEPVAPVAPECTVSLTPSQDQAEIAASVAALEAYQQLVSSHESALSDYKIAYTKWQADDDQYQAQVMVAESFYAAELDQYEIDLPIFEAKLEAARKNVDRIAYWGKVPVNVTGATPGGYIIAVEADGGGINGEFVADPDFAKYKKAVGRVNRILEDGRCEVAVMVH